MQIDDPMVNLETEDIKWEDDDSPEVTQDETVADFAKLLDDADESGLKIREGTVVRGNVVRIADDLVAVDIGHKCDGEIPLAEFKDPQGEVSIKVGDEVEVYLDTFEAID